MIGWMLRGQGHGIFTDKVFLSYPTDDDFRAALAIELEKHAVKFTYGEPDAEGVRAVTVSDPKVLWVRAHEIEVVGVASATEPSAEEKAARRFDMHGTLDAAAVKMLHERATAVPMNTAVVEPVVMRGFGTIVNPGDPGHPDTPVAAPVATAETITAADVGAVPADIVGGATPAK